jgi:ABC-type methionine transport system ATPase subunit
MSDQIIRLVYPPALLSVPVINQLIRQFDITVNILQAKIGGGDRWMDVQLAGHPSVIEEAIQWLQSQGIELIFEPHKNIA